MDSRQKPRPALRWSLADVRHTQQEMLYASRLYREGGDYRPTDTGVYGIIHEPVKVPLPEGRYPRGVKHGPLQQYNQEEYNVDLYRPLPLLEPGAAPFRDEFLQRRYQTRLRHQAKRINLQGPWDLDDGPGGPTVLTENQEDAARRSIKGFGRNTWSTSMRYCRTLGWGGQGLATLWQWKGFDGTQPTQWIVLKSSIDLVDEDDHRLDNNGIKLEKKMYNRLSRSPHVVQLFRLRDQPIPAGGLTPNVGRVGGTQMAADRVDDSNAVYIMEYAAMGTLRDLCRKAAVAGPRNKPRYFPKGVLWRFFECLVKGAYAMMCPPVFQPGNAGALVPGGGDPLSDQRFLLSNGFLPDVPPGPIASRIDDPLGNIIHFDLDPSNVFVPGLNNAAGNVDAHTQVPRLLIADFGLAETKSNLHRDHTAIPFFRTARETLNKQLEVIMLAWNQKSSGKEGLFVPEQFDASWERLPGLRTPYAYGPLGDNDIAGNYSERTNIFQIGLCMWMCMELAEAPSPPYAVRKPEWETPPVLRQDQECWTYGDTLFVNTNRLRYGAPLCDLVAKCLLRTPSQRPSLEALLAVITAQLALAANNVPGPYDGSTPGGFFTAPPPEPESVYQVSYHQLTVNAIYGVEG